MSMKMVCNRCNKVKEDGECFNRVRYICGEPELLNEYDLCPECSKLFGIFMNGGEVEEDRYKDSKPCAVVIHKLANGHYAIENAPNEKKNHCATCAYQWDPDKCPRVKETPGTISCENDAEACDKWSAVRVEEDPHVCETCTHRLESASEVNSPCYACGKEIEDNWEPAGESINKEESDLSVKTHTNAAGVTVPDSDPWRSSEDHICSTCAYEFRKGYLEPCKSCEVHNNWKPAIAEEETNEQSSET
ncbi:MAG: hypothetical protein J6U54_24415 [Clostridiales bacterium]|nr:hypothetical protein [Clostridiales bacterium]